MEFICIIKFVEFSYLVVAHLANRLRPRLVCGAIYFCLGESRSVSTIFDWRSTLASCIWLTLNYLVNYLWFLELLKTNNCCGEREDSFNNGKLSTAGTYVDATFTGTTTYFVLYNITFTTFYYWTCFL